MQGPIGIILYMGFFFALMYFLLVRPQKKKQKEMNDLRDSVKPGDSVVTIGGIVGKVLNVKTDDIVLEVGKNKMTFKKWAVSSVEPADRPAIDTEEMEVKDPAEVE
ncbi:preprotein translocase subunit YajC [Fusibacter sp. JL298sf-3]